MSRKVKIKSIKSENVTSNIVMFDLEIENEKSYNANDVFVHNSEICAGLHGKIFPKDKAPNAPLHFNCRSMLIPITKFEDYKIDEKVGGVVETKSGKKIRIPNQNINDFIEEKLDKTGFGRE